MPSARRRCPTWLLLAGLLSACDREPPRILSSTLPADTRDPVGPYAVQAIVRGLVDDDRVEVRWRTDPGAADAVQVAVAAPTEERDDVRLASLPGQPRGTRVLFYVAAVRGGETLACDPAGSGAAAGLPCPPDVLHSFQVLPFAGACTADSDCLAGELCAAGACRPFAGACVGVPDAGAACPGGYVCDEARDACVLAELPCASDLDCPSVERCDAVRERCEARPACSATAPCPDGLDCRLDLGRCF